MVRKLFGSVMAPDARQGRDTERARRSGRSVAVRHSIGAFGLELVGSCNSGKRRAFNGVVASGTLPPGHLGLDVLKSHQHFVLQLMEGGVEAAGGNLI